MGDILWYVYHIVMMCWLIYLYAKSWIITGSTCSDQANYFANVYFILGCTWIVITIIGSLAACFGKLRSHDKMENIIDHNIHDTELANQGQFNPYNHGQQKTVVVEKSAPVIERVSYVQPVEHVHVQRQPV